MLWLGCIIFLCNGCQAQTTNDSGSLSIIPKPALLQREAGFFKINTDTRLEAPGSLKDLVSVLKTSLLRSSSKAPGKKNLIRLSLQSQNSNLGEEGYQLHITPHKIDITANDTAGIIHGVFTLLQLQQIQHDETKIPCVLITDTPRFVYRGMHLDVSRHFFPVSFIKKFIDMMALYKFNTFHWHLTDGAGWRLQIKKYPLLTSIAAWRTHADLSAWSKEGRRFTSRKNTPDAYGGYYTQQEAKQVVAYAATRGITIIPEIEMPAHSQEVLAVYPGLSCSGIPYKNAEFCIGNDSTFTFLEDVLTEVMQIFPSKYIHIGGDEAPKTSWKTCPKCQNRMREEGLKDVAELQSYAIRRIEKFLTAHGRKLMGWDEILEGGLAPEATVMSWRGENGGIAAARQNHDVVMTPGAYCYFDHYQTDPNTQPPAIGGYLPIDKVYGYDPVPVDSLSASQQRHILGVQANLWSEYMPDSKMVEYRAFPRMLALAEVAWSAADNKDFDDFHRRLQAQYLLLQRHKLNYYRPSSRLRISAVPDYNKRENAIHFVSEQYQPEIRYTTDGTEPDIHSPVYEAPFYLKGKTTIKAVIFKNAKPADSAAMYVADYHEGIGKKVTYNNGGWSKTYPAQGDSTLTNGITGSLTYQDAQWQGFLHDIDVTVDMGKLVRLQRVSIRFMQLIGPGVYIPGSASILLSDDDKNYTPAATIENDISPKDRRLLFKTFSFYLDGKTARYIRLKAPNTQGGYMFTDEIQID